MPFVGLDFLESRIPLNPADDFRSTSVKCRVCEFLRGSIVQVFPAELLEQHSQRATEFLRIFLALKNETLGNAHLRELDPDWVDRHTGKKNKDGRQWRKIDEELTGDGYGEAILNRDDIYGGDSEFDVRGNYGSRKIRNLDSKFGTNFITFKRDSQLFYFLDFVGPFLVLFLSQ